MSTYYVQGKGLLTAVQEIGWGREASQSPSGQGHLAAQSLSSVPSWVLGPGSAIPRVMLHEVKKRAENGMCV